MTEGTDPAAEVLGIMADLAKAGSDVAWQVWLASQYPGDPEPHPDDLDARDAHRAGFIAGMAFLAGQVDAVLETIESRAAAPDGPARVPDTAPGPSPFNGSWGPLRRARRRLTRG